MLANALLRPAWSLTAAAVLLGLVACERPRHVAVRVSIPGPDSLETPVTGVGVVALPYDRDSVLRELERRARTPRPPTAPLESLFARFRGPFTTYSLAAYRVGKLRDSLAASRQALAATAGGAPERAGLESAAAAHSDSLRAAEARAGKAHAELDVARREFVQRSDTLRARMRQWEDSTYAGYDSLVQALARQSRRTPVTDTTRGDGWAHLTISPGRWWIYARSWDATDPNGEWYWNLPLTSDTMLLTSRDARRQPRY